MYSRRGFIKSAFAAGALVTTGYMTFLKYFKEPDNPPIPTPAPTKSPSELLEDKILNLKEDYARNRAYELRDKVFSDGVTQEKIDGITSIIEDNLFLTVSKNEHLTDKFGLQNFNSLFEELRGRTYSEYLMNNLDSLSQMVNSKVRTEDKYDYKTDIRQMNGTYIFDKYQEGKLLLSLDDASLDKLYPDKEKKDAMLMNLWFVPDWNYSEDLGRRIGYEAQKANLGMLQGIYDAVTKAHENPDFNPIEPHRIRLTEHEWTTRMWNDWLNDRANNNWTNTVAAFREIDDIISSDNEFKEKWDMMKFIFGYARSSGLPGWSIDLYYGHEGKMIGMLPVTYKAFGVPITHANSAPSDGLAVTEFVVDGIPHHIMEDVRNDLKKHEIVDFGNYGVSLYSSKKPMIDDGAKRLTYDSRPEGREMWTIN